MYCIVCLQRLQTKVLKLVDVSYGGENGFNQVSLFVVQYINKSINFTYSVQSNQELQCTMFQPLVCSTCT